MTQLRIFDIRAASRQEDARPKRPPARRPAMPHGICPLCDEPVERGVETRFGVVCSNDCYAIASWDDRRSLAAAREMVIATRQAVNHLVRSVLNEVSGTPALF